MLLQTFSKVLILVDYQANKEYIRAVLCINRDKPKLGCEGKCQLTKKLKEQEQNEKKSRDTHAAKEVQVQLFCQALFSLPAVPIAPGPAPVASYRPGHPIQAYAAIFHPPQSIA